MSSDRIVLAVFAERAGAEKAVRRLSQEDFPLDQVSLLGRAGSSGDDPLGIYYDGTGERIKGWGSLGALWGGLWGLLTGAAGMFVVPGLGPVLVAGPVVAVLANTAAGAGVAGGVMAGAAAMSHFTTAVHRMGVPEERLEELHRAIEEGCYVVMLRLSLDQLPSWIQVLERCGARQLEDYPYVHVSDALRGETPPSPQR
ncbi:MAG: hypothetical protein R3310_17495 [Candidatus Competibacteraceae bacterium]|nr:hypothetical protein [Candidatus Competibacteraceae bacterium]